MRFESTWIRVKNTTSCPHCGAVEGEFCRSKFGREIRGRVHCGRTMVDPE